MILPHPRRLVSIALLASFLSVGLKLHGQEIYDSQKETIPRQDPAQVVSEAILPPGFRMQVAASEPEIQQPIGMAWDERGRLWVAENYTYSEVAKKFDLSLSDRIVILEDTDGDGVFDKRKVFADGFKELTSIEVVPGGVYALASPNLFFLPDANHDDLPDDRRMVELQGFNTEIRHNFANGLRLGPDGWLYGRHGILGTSTVSVVNPFLLSGTRLPPGYGNGLPASGRAGAFLPPGSANMPQATKLTCGVWRYNLFDHRLEMVCEGTTNPWGMDWDAHGNLFFINTVIGHLWHAIPNAHLQRMYGEDSDPTSYELLPHIADHVHWDEKGEDWRATRLGAPSSGTDAAGGGHAHSGMMIYQADQWPKGYLNRLFTLNLHGMRINSDRLERQGAGFVGKHEPDVIRWRDPWFRGIELSTAPDGSVYVLDWSDIGECHDDDGIHRHSGRIYRISYEQTEKKRPDRFAELEKRIRASGMRDLTERDAIDLIGHPNVWYTHQLLKAIRLHSLQFSVSKELVDLAMKRKKNSGDDEVGLDPEVVQLRAIWVLDACGQLSEKRLFELLRTEQHEAVHCWAVRIFADRVPSLDEARCSEGEAEIVDCLAAKSIDKCSPLLRMYVAASLPRFTSSLWTIANALAKSEDLAQDRDFPLVFWYGLKPHVQSDPLRAAKLAVSSKIPKLSELIVRRLAAMQNEKTDNEKAPEAINWVLAEAARGNRLALQANLVHGMWATLQGRRSATAPGNWEKVVGDLIRHPEEKVREKALMLQAIFGDGVAVEQLMALALDADAQSSSRKAAIESLGILNSERARATIWEVLPDQFLGGVAAQALGRSLSPEEAKRMIEMYSGVWPPVKVGIINALGAKKESLSILLDAIESGKIAKDAIDAATWRQFTFVADWDLLTRARKINPTLGVSNDKQKTIDKLEEWLTDERLKSADAGRGRVIWINTCSSCHKLFGEGGQIGPELTGGQRSNKRYWLENIVAPSAVVATNFQIEAFLTNDGGVITGVTVSENDKEIVIQTAKDRTVVDKVDIMERRKSSLSLMPEGLLDTLDETKRADLMKYLMSPNQVAPKRE